MILSTSEIIDLIQHNKVIKISEYIIENKLSISQLNWETEDFLAGDYTEFWLEVADHIIGGM